MLRCCRAADHRTGSWYYFNGPIIQSLPVYVPRCNGARLAGFVWLALLMWLATVAYVKCIVQDLQLCGNMMRKKHCCRRFSLVEVRVVDDVVDDEACIR